MNLEGKLDMRWSREMDDEERLRVQEAVSGVVFRRSRWVLGLGMWGGDIVGVCERWADCFEYFHLIVELLWLL